MNATNTTHKAGTLRSDFARAKLALATPTMMEDVPVEKVYATIGYWDKLSYFGPVCWDSYNQLCRYLTPDHATQLRKILADSDNDLI